MVSCKINGVMQDFAGCSRNHCPYRQAWLARAVRFEGHSCKQLQYLKVSCFPICWIIYDGEWLYFALRS